MSKSSTSSIPNNLHEIGARAVTNWNGAERQGNIGDALGTFVLVRAFRGVVMKAEVRDTKTGNVEHHALFQVSDMLTPPRNDAGIVWRDMQTARNVAALDQFFGVKTITPAIKTRFNRCLTDAANILKMTTSDKVTLDGKSRLCVPSKLVMPKPKADAKESEHLEYKALAEMITPLDGGKKTLAAMRRVITPKKGRKGQDAPKSSDPKSFAVSLKFTLATVQSLTAQNGQSDIAPTTAIDKELHDLHAALTKYFATYERPATRGKGKSTTPKTDGTLGRTVPNTDDTETPAAAAS